MKKIVKFITLGCKVNQYETNAMAQKFLEKGYEVIEEKNDNIEKEVQVCIINTCTVTNMSDRKSRQMLRREKEKNKHAIIVAVGCYAQVAKEELSKIKEIDLVLGNNEKVEIVNYVEEYLEKKKRKVETEDVMQSKEFSEFGDITFSEKTRAVIKVQDGCDRFCSYCIIPYARGRVRSRKPQSIISEITEISKNGIKEVVITGIHIASYGKDFKEEYRLIDLLQEINKIEGIERIRLGSIEPLLITDEFLQRLKKLQKICHHFHLSLQSGCDETLKRMNRRYTTAQFENIVNMLRKTYQDVILTTDIIVGFPGETEEDFNETLDVIEKAGYDNAFTFIYSKRTGTPAASMEDQIPEEIVKERFDRLLNKVKEISAKKAAKYVGKTVYVLAEEKNNQEAGFITGRTEQNYIVHFKGNEELIGKIVPVKLCESKGFYYYGEM